MKSSRKANETAPIKGVMHGAYLGPTGRKRKYYTVIAHNRRNERRGSDVAYGYDGMKDAKKDIAKRETKYWGHRTWLRFYVSKRKV
jgi:hypothetical protein